MLGADGNFAMDDGSVRHFNYGTPYNVWVHFNGFAYSQGMNEENYIPNELLQ
jgi:hypothetical protein